MKKFSKILIVTLISVLILCASIIPAFADEVSTVNGQQAPVGSTVTYTFKIADAHQKIAGIHMVIFFDQEHLTLESVNADNLSGSTINDNLAGNGQIVIVNSLVNGSSGLKCEDTTELVTATFKVAASGESNVEYYIPYLYDFDMVNIYDYTLTSDLAVDGEVVIEEQTPILADVSTLDGFDAGDFANNEEGTGSGEKPVVTQAPAVDGNDGNGGSGSSSSSGTSPVGSGVLVGAICAGVVVIAIVALVVVKVVSGKKEKTESSDKPSEQ